MLESNSLGIYEKSPPHCQGNRRCVDFDGNVSTLVLPNYTNSVVFKAFSFFG